MTAELASRLDSEVELGELSFRLIPSLRVSGQDLIVRHHGRDDVPPLITIRSFSVDASLTGLWRRRVDRVTLDGLEIRMPPGEERDVETPEPDDAPEATDGGGAGEVVVDELIAADAQVIFLRRDADKPPKVWAIHDLRMATVSASTAMPFTATLTNAVPPGEIQVTGSFGPWNRTEPGFTPLNGDFIFARADLSVFKGISGFLSSTGTFAGVLGRIEAHGLTETPDFTVAVGGNPVHLTASYTATINGTDGDTRLDRIEASFLDTTILASGSVHNVEGVKGREVVLDVSLEKARLEDVLTLAVKGPRPPMTGALMLETAFRIPPGDEDIVDKLELNGAFTIEGGGFTDTAVQRQINGLSQRASGDEAVEGRAARHVASSFSGRFTLRNGALSLTPVTFDIPGAIVELNGRYGLQSEVIDFEGHLYMDARVSETVSGFKSLLLKLVDPLFRRDGRTVIPIKVGGARADPSFGLDVGRVFRR